MTSSKSGILIKHFNMVITDYKSATLKTRYFLESAPSVTAGALPIRSRTISTSLLSLRVLRSDFTVLACIGPPFHVVVKGLFASRVMEEQ